MNCEDYREQISAELDGELNEAEEPALWAHLSHCSDCRSWRREMLTIRLEFAHWPEESLPAAAMPQTPEYERPSLRRHNVHRVLAWAAGMIILLQGAYIAESLVQPENAQHATLYSPAGTVETIVLSEKDRTSHAIELFTGMQPHRGTATKKGG